MVEESMRQFVPTFKQDTINHLVTEIFAPLDLAENHLIDESVGSDSDIDSEDDENDIHI